METNQFEEIKKLVHETNQKVTEVHGVLFGHFGEGGFIRQHREFKDKTETEIDSLRKHREEVNIFKAKLIVVVSIAAAVFSFFGSKLAAFFTKLP